MIVKMRKKIGKAILALSTIFTVGAVTSMFGVGVEDMPKSMKMNR